MPGNERDNIEELRRGIEQNTSNDAKREDRVRDNEIAIEELQSRVTDVEAVAEKTAKVVKDTYPVGNRDVDASGMNYRTMQYSGYAPSQQIRQLIYLNNEINIDASINPVPQNWGVVYLGIMPLFQIELFAISLVAYSQKVRYEIFQASAKRLLSVSSRKYPDDLLLASGIIDANPLPHERALQVSIDKRLAEDPIPLWIRFSNADPAIGGPGLTNFHAYFTIVGSKAYIPTEMTVRSNQIALIQAGRYRNA